MMDKVYIQSLALHKKYQGKLAVQSKIPVVNYADLSLAYTPGVAAVCTAIAQDPQKAFSHSLKGNTVAIVSDGSAILGLGNLGASAAIPVMEGKAVLFKTFADVDAFPICLDTQNVDEIVETVKRIAPVFGGINLEDISAPRCFEIEKRLKRELSIPVMHDDQHGTATVVLAGLINALRLAEKKAQHVRVVINGVGAAGVAIANLLLLYGFKNLILVDTLGVIYQGRHGLSDIKKLMAQKTNVACLSTPEHPSCCKGDLRSAIKGADIFIGVSKGNIVDASMVRSMADNPILFAMANPAPEIMPDVAQQAGAFIVATGRSDFPNQANNVLAFPGIFRGALDHNVAQITDQMLLQAAQNLAACVQQPSRDMILPKAFDPSVVHAVARAIR